ncbi:MAG TPA: prepilin-type N-terminal cleavage/methylation domain-containing protein [Pirellulales bacterium]|jgi:prepilin-type N-terminal cleavage/methylation domain-containing protein|nr:prepilin-type N-terminal cleavage/methylation domain-containing protein [Pirellulales bacterium]
MPALTLKMCVPRSPGRRGITLIELLVVMVIVSIVTAATIPMLATGADQRRVREAARLVSSYISAAKSRAIETGRPAGVMIQRYAGQSFAMTLVGVEVPPPYCGDTTASTATINGSGQLIAFPAGDFAWQQTVNVGDIIQFGYQGRSYMLLGTLSPPTVVGQPPVFPNGTAGGTTNPAGGVQLLSATGFTGQTTGTVFCNLWATDGSLTLPPATPAAGPGVPYQIMRQPVKSATPPLQMPGDTVIDLYATTVPDPGGSGSVSLTGTSGIGITTFGTGPYDYVTTPFVGYAPYPNPMILFGPTGGVNYVYYDNNPPQHLTSALYLLIGRREGMEDLGLAATANNISHHSCMWVAVGPSALVVTAENMGGSVTTLSTARQFAQRASSIGGR